MLVMYWSFHRHIFTHICYHSILSEILLKWKGPKLMTEEVSSFKRNVATASTFGSVLQGAAF